MDKNTIKIKIKEVQSELKRIVNKTDKTLTNTEFKILKFNITKLDDTISLINELPADNQILLIDPSITFTRLQLDYIKKHSINVRKYNSKIVVWRGDFEAAQNDLYYNPYHSKQMIQNTSLETALSIFAKVNYLPEPPIEY